MTDPRSGQQLRIAAAGYQADIASVGATLRTLTHEGRDLVIPFDADVVRPAYRGATLAPWPNRIVDGAYSFDGVAHQLALTEPDRGQALHGLVAWQNFAVQDTAEDRVLLAAVIEPQTGYPFRVEVEVEYRVDADGLHQRVTGRNLGADAAPWGTGPHPYLTAGDDRIDTSELLLPASAVLTVTDERLSPVAVEPIDAHPGWDFRTSRQIGDTFIDHAFTDLTRAADGSCAVVLRGASGAGVEMVWDARCPWVQVHTADLPDQRLSRRGLAVEPMTCPPDAFNSGTDLVVIEAGAEHSAGWRIAAL